MTLCERLRLVRGAESQKAFAAALGVHENSVANAERRLLLGRACSVQRQSCRDVAAERP